MNRREETTRGIPPCSVEMLNREPSGAHSGRDVRIKLDALPISLRAVARDETAQGVMIEAELPWLMVGGTVNVELPEGSKTGHASWFGVDATRVGAARLRIYVDLTSDGTASVRQTLDRLKAPQSVDVLPSKRRMWLPLVLIGVSAAAFVSGWLAPHPVEPETLPSASERDGVSEHRRPPSRFVPVALPEEESDSEPEAPARPPIPSKPTKAKRHVR